jgi:hypothetical protein
MMSERIQMTVNMEVTIPQALALQAMFKYWNRLASIGSSRYVSFLVDGDGNFHPKCEFSFSDPIPELTPDLEALAVVSETNGDRIYDFDAIAWNIRDENE